MPRINAPTGLGQGLYQDSIDYSVFGGELAVGRIYERRASRQTFAGSGPFHGIVRRRFAPKPRRRVQWEGKRKLELQKCWTLEGLGEAGRDRPNDPA